MLKTKILVGIARAETNLQIIKDRLAEMRGLRREMRTQLFQARISTTRVQPLKASPRKQRRQS
jgi:hypothetical protein